MIVALFTNRADAGAALRELKAAGFTDNDLGMIMRDPGKPGFHDDSLVGGLITILGSLPVPGLGPLLVGGALASSLTVGDAASGTRALTKILGSPQATDAGRAHFERGLREGGIVITVHEAASPQAAHILQAHNADYGPQNRRLWNDPHYAGPERRLVGV